MKKIAWIAAGFAVLALTACAATARWDDHSVAGLRQGMTQGEVLTLLGAPQSKSTDSQGNQTWTYRRSSDENKGWNTYARIASAGMIQGFTGDVLTITFVGDRVASHQYNENVDRLGESGL